MTAHTNGIRFTREQPIGKSLVVSYPKGMPQKFAERSARALLSRQPRHRFPDYQQFGHTDDHQLVIQGLGHDLEAIQKFDSELQGYWFRAWSRAKYGIVWPGTGLDRLRFWREERRDKVITLVLIGLLAALFAVDAYGQAPEYWDCYELDGGAEANPVILLANAGDILQYVVLHGERIPAHYTLDGLMKWWTLMQSEEPYLTNKHIVLQPDRTAAYLDFTNVSEGEGTKPKMVFRCERSPQDAMVGRHE